MKRHRTIWIAVIFYLLANALDFSTSLYMPARFEEGNPFQRNPDHSFNPHRSLIAKGVATVILAFMAIFLYGAVRPFGAGLAEFVASLPFLYIACDLMLTTVGPNALMRFGIYVP